MGKLTIITSPFSLLLTVPLPIGATDDSVTMAVDVVVLFITVELLFSCTVAVDVGIILSDDVFMLDSVILLATALDEDWFNAISIKVTINFMVASYVNKNNLNTMNLKRGVGVDLC